VNAVYIPEKKKMMCRGVAGTKCRKDDNCYPGVKCLKGKCFCRGSKCVTTKDDVEILE